MGFLWTDILAALREEESAWKGVAKGTNSDESTYKTSRAVYSACSYVGLKYEDMAAVIHMYAARNLMMHEGIDQLISARNFHDLARRLAQDYKELPTVIPPHEASRLNLMQTLIESLITMWFNPEEEEDRDNPQLWNSTGSLREYRKGLNLAEAEREKRCKATWAAVESRFIQKLAKDAEQRRTVAEGTARARIPELSITTPSGEKRVSSHNLELESTLAAKR